MTETWLLLLALASGEIAIEPRETPLACDADRAAVARQAAEIEAAGMCPVVLAARCVPAVIADAAEGGE
jgi:hypothetical protein